MEICRESNSLERSKLILLLLFMAATATCQGAEKVSVELYYETLCPYSANFIVNYLEKFYTNGLIDIVDLRLIPYGNARIGPNENITCQHGPLECVLNTIEACALDGWPNLSQSFPFIYCIESLVWGKEATQWETCFESTSLDSKTIGNCYESGYGKKLELQYAEETNSLQPPHQYVPWVIVNGQPLYEDYENIEEYVCKAYKGSLPKACGSLLKIWSSAKGKAEKATKFCLKDTLSSTI